VRAPRSTFCRILVALCLENVDLGVGSGLVTLTVVGPVIGSGDWATVTRTPDIAGNEGATARGCQQLRRSRDHYDHDYDRLPANSGKMALSIISHRLRNRTETHREIRRSSSKTADRARTPLGDLVVVANHGSHADTAVLLAALPPTARPVFAAAADYWLDAPVRRMLATGLAGALPVRCGGAVRLSGAAGRGRPGAKVRA
jgi:hypothetical protein